MPFFGYRQNNSGGWFNTAMPLNLIVEAPGAGTADAIAQHHGIYFDGCAKGMDCPCCGDRWYGAGEEWQTPHQCLYTELGEPIAREDGATVKIVYLDGRVTYHNPETYMGEKWGIQ